MVSVQIFTARVNDERCDAPRRHLVEAANRERARDLARGGSCGSSRYLGIEAWDGDELAPSRGNPRAANAAGPFVGSSQARGDSGVTARLGGQVDADQMRELNKLLTVFAPKRLPCRTEDAGHS